MTRDERLLKRALDVLDGAHDVFGLEKDGIAIKTALRERLAQPEQEPVATVRCINGITIGYLEVMQPVGTKLYTTPPQRKPLTEKRIEELYSFWVVDCQDIVGFARAVERTVKGEA